MDTDIEWQSVSQARTCNGISYVASEAYTRRFQWHVLLQSGSKRTREEKPIAISGGEIFS